MKRRNFLKASSVTLAAATLAPVVTQANLITPNTKTVKKNEFISHYVLFWLKPDVSENDIANFTGFFEELRKVPNVKTLHYGRAANSTPRDVVDNSFTYTLLVSFDSLEDLETYGTHPIHLQAIEKYSKYWNKVVVHDAVLK